MTQPLEALPREIALLEGHRVWAEIDLDCLAHNVSALQQRAGAAHLLAVVKGNAYGHGAIAVARTALSAGAWGLGVVSVEEGEELRRAGIDAPVLVLGSTSPRLAARAVGLDLRLTVATVEGARAFAAAAVAAGKLALVHVKVETGLNRYGLLPEAAAALAEGLRELPGIIVEGLSTHLASVDEGDKTFTLQQYAAFCACAKRLPWVPLHHVSSTGALLDLPELSLAMVRTGIGLYGYYPSDEVLRSVELRPVMALRSRVARVSSINPGDSVGYGRTWTAERPSRIATVMAGYGDGVRRALSNNAFDLVRGRRAPVIGRIAMDMHMIDVTDVGGVEVEDEVTILGSQGGETIDADEIAGRAGTISYEIITGVMARVPRLYVQDGKIVACQDGYGYRSRDA
jgi:alanine racemase